MVDVVRFSETGLQMIDLESARAACLSALKQAQADGIVTDREQPHIDADAALCEFLRAIGHNDIADEYENIPKWFA